MQLVLATHNAHKISEVTAILAGTGVELLGLSRWPELVDLPETADTFEGCAEQKARAVWLHTGLPAVADDSGLEVDALGGAPGVRSKRFSPEQTDLANNRLLLERLASMTSRQARFRCVVAVAGPFDTAFLSGRCEGIIAYAPRGEGGFGYDPLFLPEGQGGRAMAELSADEKNQISHRGRAFRQLPALLARLGLGGTP